MLPPSPFLYPIIDADFGARIVEDSCEVLRAGAKIVQLRAKHLPKKAIYDAVMELTPAFSESKALLIVNDYVDIAMITDATGVHIGQNDFPPGEGRALLPDKVIGFSTHTLEQVAVADEFPLDYIAIGPVYQTLTKADAHPPVGLQFLRRIREITRHSLVAIGGIESAHLPELLVCGVDGIAMISEIYRNGSIYDRVSRLLEIINQWKLRQHPD